MSVWTSWPDFYPETGRLEQGLCVFWQIARNRLQNNLVWKILFLPLSHLNPCPTWHPPQWPWPSQYPWSTCSRTPTQTPSGMTSYVKKASCLQRKIWKIWRRRQKKSMDPPAVHWWAYLCLWFCVCLLRGNPRQASLTCFSIEGSSERELKCWADTASSPAGHLWLHLPGP